MRSSCGAFCAPPGRRLLGRLIGIGRGPARPAAARLRSGRAGGVRGTARVRGGAARAAHVRGGIRGAAAGSGLRAAWSGSFRNFPRGFERGGNGLPRVTGDQNDPKIRTVRSCRPELAESADCPEELLIRAIQKFGPQRSRQTDPHTDQRLTQNQMLPRMFSWEL